MGSTEAGDETRGTEAIPIIYPKEATNETARQQYKHKLLKDNPETLYADFYKKDEKICNMIFYTDSPMEWHKAMVDHYPWVKKAGFSEGKTLKISDNEDTITTVNFYCKTGKVVIQGANLKLLQNDFTHLKNKAQERKSSPTTDNHSPASHSSDNLEEHTRGEGEPPTDHTTQNYLHTMRERFTQLEVELVQLRQTVSSLQSEKEKAAQTQSSKPQQMERKEETESYRKELAALRKEVKQLQQDRESCMAQLTAMREEVREIKQEKERETPTQTNPTPEHNSLTPTQTDKVLHTQPSPSTSQTETAHPTQTPPATPQLDTVPVPHTPPLTPQSDTVPPTQMAQTTPQEAATPSREKDSRQQEEVVILIDSNGKFIEKNKLFPKHRVAKIWCPNTQRAMELLNVEQLGSPTHIIIHTGTNDLRTQQEKVAISLRAVIEKASSSFPNSRVIISTLLQRKDFHPDIIQKINVSISRDCALKPNVHLANHPTLDLDSLHDHVHLHKKAVPTFARTLKDAALNRNPITSHRSHRPPALMPPRPGRHTLGPAGRRPPQRPEHHQQTHAPHHTHPAQHRPTQGSYRPPFHSPLQERPEPLLPRLPSYDPPDNKPAPFFPLNTVPHPPPGSPSYAQAVSRPAQPPTLPTSAPATSPSGLKNIEEMLSFLCSHVMGNGAERVM